MSRLEKLIRQRTFRWPAVAAAGVLAVIAATLVAAAAPSQVSDSAARTGEMAVASTTEAASTSTAGIGTIEAQTAISPARPTDPSTSEQAPTTTAPVTATVAEQVSAPAPVEPATAPEPATPVTTTPEPVTPVTTTPEPAATSSGNWMTDMLPQVDPGGAANWVFERNGSWGASDGHTIYIDPDIPSDKRFSVLVHEYSHVLQVQVFGSLSESIAATSAIIGGSPSDITANESTADCMALLQGATWVNYGCQDSLQAAASAILAGQRP